MGLRSWKCCGSALAPSSPWRSCSPLAVPTGVFLVWTCAIFSRTKGARSGLLFARWFRTKTRGSAFLLAQKGRGSRRSRRMPTSPWATPSSSPAGPRATPSPRSSGCGTSECFRTRCWAPGPRHRTGCWGPQVPTVRGVLDSGSQPSDRVLGVLDRVLGALGPSHWTGAELWVPAVREVLGAGSQPSDGCWAPGPSHPGTPGAPGCLPTLTLPPPPS